MYQNNARGIFVRVDNGVMDEYMKPAKRKIKIISSERYEGGDDAAQVSIVEDVPLLPTCNRSRPRNSTINSTDEEEGGQQ